MATSWKCRPCSQDSLGRRTSRIRAMVIRKRRITGRFSSTKHRFQSQWKKRNVHGRTTTKSIISRKRANIERRMFEVLHLPHSQSLTGAKWQHELVPYSALRGECGFPKGLDRMLTHPKNVLRRLALPSAYNRDLDPHISASRFLPYFLNCLRQDCRPLRGDDPPNRHVLR